ncbi:PaaI family thioesterase [Tepidicaulis sp. LMO-SS28]|uniref:PaaI family thioesterase n=1 Tax=Tepidicaulis sp. LMO-SS28 TaxID=3447455 RepID=UPI003EE0D2B3
MPSWKNILKRIQDQDIEKAPPHVHALNLYAGRLSEVEEGRIVYEWEVNPDYMNPAAVFGGYLATLADQTCSFALMTELEDDKNFTTSDLQMHFFRPVTKGTIRCEGRVLNRSKTQAYVEATFTNDEGKLVLKARAVERILAA